MTQRDVEVDRRSLLHKELAQTRAVRENLRKLSGNSRVDSNSKSGLIPDKRISSNNQEDVADSNESSSRRTSPRQITHNFQIGNVENGGSVCFEDQLRWFYERYNHEKLTLVKTLVNKCPTQRDQLRVKFQLLEKYGHIPLNSIHLAWKFALTYSPPPSSLCYFCCCSSSTFGAFKNDRLVSDLIRFYERFNPAKLTEPSLSKLVMSSRNADEIEVAMIKLKLLLKYQLFPSMSDVAGLVSEQTTCNCCDTIEKLSKSIKLFYQRVHSSKAHQVVTIVDRYGGMKGANELKFKLLIKYQFVSLTMEGRSVANRFMFDLNTMIDDDDDNNNELQGFRLPKKVRPKHVLQQQILST